MTTFTRSLCPVLHSNSRYDTSLCRRGGRKEEGGNGSAALVHELLPTRPAAGFLGIAES